MKVKEFIAALKKHNGEVRVTCRDGHGYAVDAGICLVIFPSEAVLHILPAQDAQAEREIQEFPGTGVAFLEGLARRRLHRLRAKRAK